MTFPPCGGITKLSLGHTLRKFQGLLQEIPEPGTAIRAAEQPVCAFQFNLPEAQKGSF